MLCVKCVRCHVVLAVLFVLGCCYVTIFCEQSMFRLSLCSLFSIGSMQSMVSCGQLELSVSAVLPSVTRLGASALEAARFAVSALEAARFAVPTCQPSGHTQRELRILASAPSAERPIPWPSNFT